MAQTIVAVWFAIIAVAALCYLSVFLAFLLKGRDA